VHTAAVHLAAVHLAAVHLAAVPLTPILGAEKSKVPFYVAGGVLVAWALIASLALGLRKPDFPRNPAGQRAVAAISAVLVLAAVSTAVITSGPAEKAGAQSGASTQTTAQETPSAPADSTPASSTPAAPTPTASTPTTSPKATTGTPIPPSSPAAATTTLKLAANPAGQLSYNVKRLSAKAGKVTIDFANASPIEHDVTIAQGSSVLGATPVFAGGSKTLTLTLKPGAYTFYCSVPGHRQAGMEGTLSVS
jgi:plastocyanin